MYKKNKWIKIFEERKSAPYRLFCFHFAGGGASVFKRWNNSLPGQIELCAVQLPGREERYEEPAFTCYKDAVSHLMPELLPFLDRPFFFFCHSMGTIIGFHLVLEIIEKYGLHPVHIFFSSSAAPHNKPLFKKISHLADDQFIQEIKNFGGIPSQILNNPDFIKILLPILRKDFQLIESFEYSEGMKLHCPLTIFGGKDDRAVPVNKLEGWDRVTLEKANIQLFPGNHFYFIDQQEEVIEAILSNISIEYEYPEIGLFSNEYGIVS
ncbi:MAG: thioesterase [Spirochaetales bacterium]|nr:thioesterase [Spirochaetales bacterium]